MNQNHNDFRIVFDSRNLYDKIVTCSDCLSEFIFIVNEQLWYQKMGFPVPKRCPDCRARRKIYVSRLGNP